MEWITCTSSSTTHTHTHTQQSITYLSIYFLLFSIWHTYIHTAVSFFCGVHLIYPSHIIYTYDTSLPLLLFAFFFFLFSWSTPTNRLSRHCHLPSPPFTTNHRIFFFSPHWNIFFISILYFVHFAIPRISILHMWSENAYLFIILVNECCNRDA